MRRPEIKHPVEGKLMIYTIHCPKCSASKQTERAMRMWDYYHPEAPMNFLGRERLGVEEIMENYLYLEEKGMKIKSLPTFFISWSKRPRLVFWWTTGGIDSRNPSQVNDFYGEIEKACEKVRKVINDGIRKGLF